MRDERDEVSGPVIALVIMAAQFPVWLAGGVVWACGTAWLTGQPAGVYALAGVFWGLAMWGTVGTLLSVLFAWRREVTVPVADERDARDRLERAMKKLNLRVKEEADGEMRLAPRWALFRFRFQEVVVTFEDGAVTVAGPALVVGQLRKQMK